VRPGRAADHSPPSSAAVMEEYSYTSTHLLGHTGPVTGSLYLCTAKSCLSIFKKFLTYYIINAPTGLTFNYSTLCPHSVFTWQYLLCSAQ